MAVYRQLSIDPILTPGVHH